MSRIPKSAPLVNAGANSDLIGRPSGHAHTIVYETAVAMAHELYDTLMQRDDWYSLWKSWHEPGTSPADLEASFVKRNVPGLLAGARSILAASLRTCRDPALADSIAEALLLDATLARPGARGQKGLN